MRLQLDTIHMTEGKLGGQDIDMMKFIIITYYGEGDAQRAWSGKRWISDVSVAEEYDTEARALRAFRVVVGRAYLVPQDRACLVEDYGLVTERVAYHMIANGCVVAAPKLSAARSRFLNASHDKGGSIKLETLARLLESLASGTTYPHRIAVEITVGAVLKTIDNEDDAQETIRRITDAARRERREG